MSNGHYVTYHTGTEASPSLQVDTALSARYLAVSDSTSVSHAIEKTGGQCIASMQTRTSLRCRIMLLAETTLARRLKEMSPIGNGSNEDVVQDWKDFIVSWGSHVIINSACGARFQLNVWAPNSNSSVNERFSTSVTAAFDGVVAGGQFDASVKTEGQYKTLSEFMQ